MELVKIVALEDFRRSFYLAYCCVSSPVTFFMQKEALFLDNGLFFNCHNKHSGVKVLRSLKNPLSFQSSSQDPD